MGRNIIGYGLIMEVKLGFANAIPFTAIDQRLSVRIWSPQSGVTVMLKLEDETNGHDYR